jgi:hypothetical protein
MNPAPPVTSIFMMFQLTSQGMQNYTRRPGDQVTAKGNFVGKAFRRDFTSPSALERTVSERRRSRQDLTFHVHLAVSFSPLAEMTKQ